MGHLRAVGGPPRPSPNRSAGRSTTDVILDHLDCRSRQALEDDLSRNYDGATVVISQQGAGTGANAVRREAGRLSETIPEMRFRVTSLVADGPYALMEWTARGRGVRVDDGADSFVVDRGRIVCQTIHYTARPAD